MDGLEPCEQVFFKPLGPFIPAMNDRACWPHFCKSWRDRRVVEGDLGLGHGHAMAIVKWLKDHDQM
jgi:hypothetical protein